MEKMTEIPSYILCQYMWYNADIQVDKTSSQFSGFSEKKDIHYILKLFSDNCSIESGMNLRENTIYMKIPTLRGWN